MLRLSSVKPFLDPDDLTAHFFAALNVPKSSWFPRRNVIGAPGPYGSFIDLCKGSELVAASQTISIKVGIATLE